MSVHVQSNERLVRSKATPTKLLMSFGVAMSALLAASGAQAQTKTLQDAMITAYSNNPALQAARAQLRATDENVPAALAGWHPTVTLSGTAGPSWGTQTNPNGLGGLTTTNEKRYVTSGTATVTQPIYRGGRTVAATNKAESLVMAQRASLLAQEEQTFSDTVTAYVNVIAAQQTLDLDRNNEEVLTRQLQATNDRFRVGEITRTDVAQAEAALAGAVATRETAEGALQSARASYQKTVGELPGTLIPPQPLALPSKTLEEAKALARGNNPNVVAAVFKNASDKDNFDLQYAALMPQVALQATGSTAKNQTYRDYYNQGSQVGVTVTVPLYQGGSEYAAIRQARQSEQQSHQLIDDARATAVQQAISAWETYQATKSSIASNRQQIKANEVALEGVQREAIVGSRTTLDVLNAEQALLTSRTQLVQNLATLVANSYGVAAAVGRLTARDLNLPVPYYNEKAYYEAVRNLWIGTGDYAPSLPGK
ncbi:MAG: TolC family outer membrane protein [Acetobacteraceae bacterium]|nr:TolC family outer membrane protein [Acetobacteraceae bacterium]